MFKTFTHHSALLHAVIRHTLTCTKHAIAHAHAHEHTHGRPGGRAKTSDDTLMICDTAASDPLGARRGRRRRRRHRRRRRRLHFRRHSSAIGCSCPIGDRPPDINSVRACTNCNILVVCARARTRPILTRPTGRTTAAHGRAADATQFVRATYDRSAHNAILSEQLAATAVAAAAAAASARSASARRDDVSDIIAQSVTA